jgi:EAL domain-containing protein (putative c-di-GMP-specific phosphodiesterase class I)
MPDRISDHALIASIRILYQPIIRLADLRPDYLEVLARAATSDGNLDGPEGIVAAMSEPERSMRLTTCIMERALAEYEEHSFGEEPLSLAFNLPLDAMLHPELVARIEAVRTSFGIAAKYIRFELTERHPVDNLAGARAAVVALRNAGYGLALDDVTPAMPNLPALMDMPIRAIKLDRSIVIPTDEVFIRDMVAQTAPNAQDTIAEGIETHTTLESMRALDVTHGQGYLFSRPLRAAAVLEFMRS